MALEVKKQQSASSSSWSFCNMKCLQIIPSRLSSSSSKEQQQQQQQQRDGKILSDSDTKQRKPGGWKAMPFILGLSLSLSLSHTHTHKCKHIDTVRNAWDLTEKVLALYIFWCAGNETFERMASFGLLANFMVYLTRELHMDQASAANILNLWSGVSNFAPLLGAFISDSYVGRFRTIAFGSFALFLVCPPSFLNYLL